MKELKYPNLFQPITLGKTVFRNRIFASPTGFQNGDHNSRANKEMIAYYELKALGGAASVTMGDCVVDAETGAITKVQFPIDDPDTRGGLASFAKAITRHGAVASVELQHGGMCARLAGDRNGFLYGPIDTVIPHRPGGNPQVREDGSMIEVREMTEEMIEYLIGRFGDAAAFAKSCGCGMVMVHGGHGWLLSQFMSPETNLRSDKWGGRSIENRMRFPLAVVSEIKRRCGQSFPIEFRMSGSECNDKGYGIKDGIEMAKQLDGKVELIHVSAGNHEIADVFYETHPSMFHEDGCNVKYAAEIKKHVKTPVACVGALTDPAQMEEIIASGMADVVELGRQTLADPDLPIKARTGREDEIRQCMRCYSCFSECDASRQFQCAINPVTGLEYESKFDVPPRFKKRVLVAGGGIAGMQAALTAAERGHEVILCEKEDSLGGILRCEENVPFKAKLKKYIDRQKLMVSRAKIDVRLGTAVTPQLAREIGADAIIAALGSRPVTPNIPGIKNGNVVSAEVVYYDPQKCGKTAVILGGGLVGVELALYLTSLGRTVTILEMLPALNYGAAVVHGSLLDIKLDSSDVSINLSTKASEITKAGVLAELNNGARVPFNADTVIIAAGQKPEWEQADALRFLCDEFYQIGDCLTPKNILSATQAAYHAARDIGRY